MNKLHIFLLSLALTFVINVSAQEASRSGYFLNGYSFRHELNPAFDNDYNYISIPALGNINVGTASNVGVNTFMYKLPNGQLTTFMNPSVSSDDFISKLSNNNRITSNLNLTVLSAGFRGFGGFNTITLSTRADIGANLPKGLFEFMKLGQQGTSSSYSFEDFNIKASAMAEVAIGHSHAINEHLEIGAKLKFLVGAGSLNANIDKMNITLSDNKWEIQAKGSLDMAAGSDFYVPTKQEVERENGNVSQSSEIEWDEVSYDKFSTSGMGIGVDLGVVYRNVVPGLTLSASVIDLGFINWSDNIKGETPDTKWTFDGFRDVAIDSSQPGYEEDKLSEQFEDIFDDLKDCVNFHRTSTGGSRSQALAATIYFGAEYEMPFYNRLTAGLLFTQRINGAYSWTEGRLSANLKPSKWFDCSVNVAQSTFGTSFGWVLNFHPRGFNLFIGTDHQFFEITPQFLPVGNANANINVGFNITFK